MKNKKGFTLIELLAVIAILGTIISIVTISAIKVSNQRRKQDYENIISIIRKNTKTMVETDYKISNEIDKKFYSNINACKITYKKLVDANIMDDDIINPVNNKSLQSTCVKVSKNNTTFEYQYDYIDDESECNKIEICF